LTLPRRYDQRWMFVSCLKSIQADYHRRVVRSRLRVHGMRAELRTVVEQTPRDTRAVTLFIAPFPSDPGSPLVQQPLSSESTSETAHGLLVEGPTVNYLRCATWVLVRPPRFKSCGVIPNPSYAMFICSVRPTITREEICARSPMAYSAWRSTAPPCSCGKCQVC
jgi:hypothetical protein